MEAPESSQFFGRARIRFPQYQNARHLVDSQIAKLSFQPFCSQGISSVRSVDKVEVIILVVRDHARNESTRIDVDAVSNLFPFMKSIQDFGEAEPLKIGP